ncbi:hypothetical protein OG301_26580 [Streptomyces platensis]|uniref:hypothetical protein n=1 Tax=Streptomyces platensis TaxID=58346 RepID=UPI002ED54E0F|nr:hypothetical protein OG301_26580 [Streptomyces platensis]
MAQHNDDDDVLGLVGALGAAANAASDPSLSSSDRELAEGLGGNLADQLTQDDQ